jgi:hypothetical protein
MFSFISSAVAPAALSALPDAAAMTNPSGNGNIIPSANKIMETIFNCGRLG